MRCIYACDLKLRPFVMEKNHSIFQEIKTGEARAVDATIHRGKRRRTCSTGRRKRGKRENCRGEEERLGKLMNDSIYRE